jgi:alkylation response protein AidB-like acyl-CoA dehydrogenase
MPNAATPTIDAARALAPEVSARADEIARARRLPADLVAQLKRAGVFRMPMPRAWGGPELGPREQTEVVEILSAADPSVGWCAMIGSDGGFYGAFLEEAPARALYPDLDYVTAGMLQPAGRAQRVAGGYRVTGRWGFGSGCTHAEVLVGGCLVFDGDTLETTPAGRPAWRVAMAPAAAWTVLDTWHTTGLAGSGSHDYTAEDLFVPDEHTFSLTEKVRRPEPLYAFNGMFFANMRGVPLGLARRAIDCAIAVAEKKVVMPEMTRLRDVPRVRAALARAQMQLGAARAYTYETLDRVWEQLQTRGELSLDLRVAMSLSRIHAFRVAREVAQAMVDTIGASAIYATSPLDRLLRDAITMSQHVVAQERVVEMIGGMLVGETPPIPFL